MSHRGSAYISNFFVVNLNQTYTHPGVHMPSHECLKTDVRGLVLITVLWKLFTGVEYTWKMSGTTLTACVTVSKEKPSVILHARQMAVVDWGRSREEVAL